MRLLHLLPDGGIVPREFTGTDIPPYAILSHTWHVDNSQEVTLRDLEGGVANTKLGHQKIEFCAKQALADGLEYCWVDTCCIDKTSSAELSEAINSMFRWYQQAAICYVYLLDLDRDAFEKDFSCLGACRWFSRGWCLQELLAPKRLHCYSSDWSYIGSKSTLRDLICDITKIDLDVLEDPSLLYTKPIARRMSWAARRITTRPEDMAYSLLGLFDVQMPMLYGEGSKAFVRLQEEIIKKSNDFSILAWRSTTPTPYWDMFAQSASCSQECHTLCNNGPSGGTFSASAFSVTNRGLHIFSPDFRIRKDREDYPHGEYVLRLACNLVVNGETSPQYVLLKKIGSGLFVRLPISAKWLASSAGWFWPHSIEKDVFVVQHITPSLTRHIEMSHQSCFDVRMAASRSRPFPIQALAPRDAWDDPSSRFLTMGDAYFAGYLKFSAHMQSEKSPETFILALCFENSGERPPKPCVCLIQEGTWQCCDTQGRPLRVNVRSAINEQRSSAPNYVNNRQSLTLESYMVEVTLETRISHRRTCAQN